MALKIVHNLRKAFTYGTGVCTGLLVDFKSGFSPYPPSLLSLGVCVTIGVGFGGTGAIVGSGTAVVSSL